MAGLSMLVNTAVPDFTSLPSPTSRSFAAGGHERDGHNFFQVADEEEDGGFLVVSPEGMSDVGEGEC